MNGYWHLSCKLKARNFDSGLSQLSSCHVMSCGDRKSFRPSSGCCFLNFMSPLQARESHSVDMLMRTVLWSSSISEDKNRDIGDQQPQLRHTETQGLQSRRRT
jgi:hypothetical protein